ncbi:hypothetical protein HZS_459 [Henneguya salminicola]|nr:hypothetical protein HZS_459 [Henneguya salminicola]
MIYLEGLDKLAVGFEAGNIHLYDGLGQTSDYLALQRHINPIVFLKQISLNSLLSLCKAGELVIWDLALPRQMVKSWPLIHKCVACNQPYYWNIYGILTQMRHPCIRHHCRICGGSFCIRDSKHKCTSFKHGYEIPVRVCNECYKTTDNSFKPSLSFKLCMKVGQASLNRTTGQLFFKNKQSDIKMD